MTIDVPVLRRGDQAGARAESGAPPAIAGSAHDGRAGQLSCVCEIPPPPETEGATGRGSVLVLATGFAVAALAQALAAGLLPLAAADMAPRYAGLPYAALLAGAAVATFPASFLLDGFGRRTGFALGASIGIAGGLLVAVAVLHRQFAWLCLGAFWIGIAQGFGFFYRHAAELGRGSGERTAAIAGVFAAGSLAGIAGPSLASFAEGLTSPYVFVGTSLLIALAHVAGLAVAVTRPVWIARPMTGGSMSLKAIAGPTLCAAAAWFAMNGLMVATPLAMAECGIAAGTIFGAVSWHVVAMYAPAVLLLVPALQPRFRALGLGAGLLAAAFMAQKISGTAAPFALGLVLAGIGWSLVTVATTAWMHALRPSRPLLALHDGVLFAAAIAGSLLGGWGAAHP